MSGKSSRVWSALSSTRFSLGLERAPPSTDAAVDPSPCTKLAGGTEDGMIRTTAKELPSVIWSRADFDSSTFSIDQNPCQEGCKGKGRKSRNSLGSLRWTTTSNPTTLKAVPAHRCYMRSSGCWARSLPHAGCTARPALL